MSYAIFFSDEEFTLRIPVNPEELNIEKGQEVEEYDILKLGKISVPTNMELMKFSFEAEFPSKPYHYVVTQKEFKPAQYYIDKFEQWRIKKKPIRFVATNGIRDISKLVLFKNIQEIEKAGEVGDYYLSFDLVEYRPHAMREVVVTSSAIASVATVAKATIPARPANPPKPQQNIYTIVKGDTLWALAKKFLGDGSRFPEIHKINQPPLGKNPNLIYSGQKIKIP